jgi:hypothetical protein
LSNAVDQCETFLRDFRWHLEQRFRNILIRTGKDILQYISVDRLEDLASVHLLKYIGRHAVRSLPKKMKCSPDIFKCAKQSLFIGSMIVKMYSSDESEFKIVRKCDVYGVGCIQYFDGLREIADDLIFVNK